MLRALIVGVQSPRRSAEISSVERLGGRGRFAAAGSFTGNRGFYPWAISGIKNRHNAVLPPEAATITAYEGGG